MSRTELLLDRAVTSELLSPDAAMTLADSMISPR